MGKDESKVGRKRLELAGQQFGRLTVLSFAGIDKTKHSLWRCQCDCGNEVTVVGTSLNRGHTRSCGCLSRDFALGLRLPMGQAAFNKLYYGYRKGAQKRGLPFELSKEEFETLSKMDCHYCGLEAHQVIEAPDYRGEYLYNGIDRTDSKRGYMANNCVPCCKKCNIAKGSLAVEEFENWVERAYLHILERHRAK